MAAQSGIVPTQQLLDTWSAVLADPSTRLVKIVIKDEQLVAAGTWSSSASDPSAVDAVESDFALLERQDVVEDKVSAYYVYRLSSPPSSTFLFISYVPDYAPVRAKMLYASTRNTLVRALGDSKIISSIFATSKSDLTYASYLSHVAHDEASAPLTAREQEMFAIRAAEAEASQNGAASTFDSREGRSMVYGAAGNGAPAAAEAATQGDGDAKGVLPWSEEANAAVRQLGEAEEGALVQLELDVPTETVVLSPTQPASLADLPPSSPVYVFYRHAAGVVLVYVCPPSSPIKHRLLYSASVLILYRIAVPRLTGITVLKKLETDDPQEVTPSWIDSELGPTVTAVAGDDGPAAMGSPATPASGTTTPSQQEEDKPKFARPARPGRKR